jgi:glucose/arabinose dehydrogenase/regulation of enolase protein 1 (concanavalin A-like superfamily)
MRRFVCTALSAFLVSVAPATWALPSGFVKSKLVGGLSKPTAMAFAPDGRIFVTERGTPTSSTARVRIIKNGSLLSTPFASFTVDNTSIMPNERGLVGLAIDPSFATNHFVYVYYTVAGSSPHNRIARFTANGDVATTNTPFTLLDLEALKTGRHNGGGMLFGKDGKLYVGVGENGTAANAPDKSKHLGKILRLNPDGSAPSDNPFFDASNGTSATDRIWAYGLRNPFTLAVQPGTGRIFVNDVGESSWEEIDDLVKGKNYGWDANMNDGDSTAWFKYDHSVGKSIAGGTFYNPSVVPPAFTSYVGKYFFADYVSGLIQVINPSDKSHSNFEGGLTTAGLVDLDVGPDGDLYYTAVSAGEIWKVSSSTTATQSIVVSTNMLNVNEAGSASFTVRLAAKPSANVVVAVARTSGDTSVTFTPASLTFTTSSWSTAQTVKVSAAEDADTLNESAALSCTSSGLGTQKVVANAIDNDDGSAPSTLISAPVEGDVLRGTSGEFFGGSNLDGSTTKGQFFIDGALKYTDTGQGHYHYLGSHLDFDTTLLKEGGHVLKLSVTDSAGRVGSHQINVSVDNLPSPWNHQDIGAVGAAGSASQSSGKYTVNASGADIWGSADELHFVYKALSGDGEIKARVASVENTNVWAKAGVMIRETLAADAKQAFMLVSAGGQLAFQRRTSAGGASASTAGPAASAPRWVRLKRAGSTITAFQSADGSTWSTVGTATISMATSVMVGLALTSHADGTVCTAVFDNVATSGTTSAASVELFSLEGEEIDDSPGTVPAPADGMASEASDAGAFGCGGDGGHGGRSAAGSLFLLGIGFGLRRRRRR